MTLSVDARREAVTARIPSARAGAASANAPSTSNTSSASSASRRRPQRPAVENKPVEFWPTAAIRDALETDDLTVWQRIAAAIKRDPYGRTARQVEEVLESTRPYGVSKALSEVLSRSRENLEANERAEVARLIRALLGRSGLKPQEFASRIGVSGEEFAHYLEARTSPPASLMVRMSRLSDRFAKMKAQRANGGR
ncbi:XRE family transcriptional regulator [Mycolicibacterium agri]|uniref:Uncharacterized protein n=1 Tax=Mycolicibacterium agri TaxID=36811 RepID=A0A7I9W656_MYCAG|nr:XRE family transcriptional regulator [Mycolicibacterium agri]GFG53185.1 hypothetical protein MAGR_46260 [Mycolicibacterium agri]